MTKAEVDVVHLGYEHTRYRLKERRAVHVDRVADGEHEPTDASVHAQVNLDTTKCDRKCQRAVAHRDVYRKWRQILPSSDGRVD